MKESYSIYEAKARLSEILRHVRHGRPVVITDRRRPVARVVAFSVEGSLEDRIRLLEERGVIWRSTATGPRRLRPIAHRPGTVGRFLKTRHRY